MSEHISITHPDLPGRSISIRPDALPHYKRAGWTTRTPRRAEPPVRVTKTADVKSEPKPEPDDQSAENKEN